MDTKVDGVSTSADPAADNLPQAAPPVRWRDFARHYVACGVASKAARLAGYSEDYDRQAGWRLMQRPEVQALIEEERAERLQRLNVTPERIIEALAAIAFGDPREIAGWDAEGNGTITPSDQLTDDQAMLIAGLEQIQRFGKEGEPVSTALKFKFASRQAALDALARINGMYSDKIQVETIDGVAKDMADLRARRRARQGAGDDATVVDAVLVDNKESGGGGLNGLHADAGALATPPTAGVAPGPSEPQSSGGDGGGPRTAATPLAGADDGTGATRPIPSAAAGQAVPLDTIQPGIARRFAASLPKEDGDGVAGS